MEEREKEKTTFTIIDESKQARKKERKEERRELELQITMMVLMLLWGWRVVES